MIKKILICLLIINLAIPTLAFANTPIMDGTPLVAKVYLDDFEITFTNPPLYLQNKIMVPARAVFEKLGVQIYWIDKTQELLAYRDNVFVKIQIDNPVAHVNGKATSMGITPLVRSGEIFIPASFIANAFDLNYTLDSKMHSINLDFRENLYEYEQFNDQHYKKINTLNWGISFFIPEYWEKLDGTYASYGYSSDYEYYKFEPRVIPLDSDFNRVILSNALINNLKYEYGLQISNVKNTERLYNDFLCRVTTYDFKDDQVLKKRFIYVFFENNNGYIFEGEVNTTVDSSDARNVFDTIANTFQISKLTVDDNSEHYIELAKFFEMEMHLDMQLYSNMTVENQFLFSGTFPEDTALKGLHIIVSKGSETTEYYAPLISGAFKANIFTPFGLGKHNITVMVDDAGSKPPLSERISLGPTLDDIVNNAISLEMPIDSKKIVMKFSILNTSDDAIKFLLPSDYIDYDAHSVYQTANGLTYNLTNDYAKSKMIYEWIVDNYTYEPILESTTLSSTTSMISKTSGTEVDLSILYAGLMRSMNVPSRIVRGTNEQVSHYWVENFINGKWQLSDIAWEIKYKDDQSQKKLQYFNINMMGHYSQYKKTEFLPF
ncbi:stalk domain-containing protein [Fusibacter sp. 3D3]|uniref:stalk domain-containing protein n=1 Tax=Fusibacter sp. 3D3 TaxID=1048380 RepID=UPI000853E1E0|nr:stalk domain-containing protein [Fusibacter sp. 3D3]GAU75751.1 conserved domain protein [Fusibacter sp. 3D3]